MHEKIRKASGGEQILRPRGTRKKGGTEEDRLTQKKYSQKNAWVTQRTKQVRKHNQVQNGEQKKVVGWTSGRAPRRGKRNSYLSLEES